MAVSQSIFYKLGNSDSDIELTITVGEAQLGATSIRMGNKLIVDSSESIVIALLGNAKDIHSSKCIATTVVTDIVPATNRTTVTWNLTGGETDFKKSVTETLDSDGDSILYAATIYLI